MSAASTASAARALFQDYRAFAGPRLPLALLLMAAGAIAEGFGILMIVPLMAFAVDAASLPARIQPLLAIAGGLSRDQRFLVAIAIFVAAMSARAALLYARDMLLVRLQAEHEASMQLRAAATLASRGWPFAARIGQAGMQALLLGDLNRAALAVTLGQQAAVAIIMLLVQLGLALFLSPGMAAIALGLILAGYAASWRWVRKGDRTGATLSAAFDQSTAAGFRLHAGLKSALAQGTVAQFLREYRSSLANVVESWRGIARDSALLRASAGLASAIAASGLLLIGVQLFHLPFALLIALLVVFARMSGPAQSFQQSLQSGAVAASAFTAVEQRIGPLPRHLEQVVRTPRSLDWRRLELVSVAYRHHGESGLADASLTLNSGEWLGVGGGSGQGKTTLLDVVAGLLPPQSGRLLVDGQALSNERMERWRDGLAYVAQGEMLFDDSVRGNLLADGAGAQDDELWRALDVVGLSTRVKSLPAGLDQQVGDRGSSFSGGERQRLALARAILRRPRLLILDEATSALDPASEEKLFAAMRSISPRPAALVVAHRERTLALCDRRVTVAGGALVAS